MISSPCKNGMPDLPPWRARTARAAVAVALLVLFASLPASAQLDHVTLLLKWDHQFQFAGYYAAQWQGYYADAGIDVEFQTRVQPDGSLLNVVDEVAEGRADFGVGSIDILVARDQGIPLIIVSSIFQRSPYALVSLKDVPLASPKDLIGKRVAYQAGALGGMELDALLYTERIPPSAITRVPFLPGIEPLLEGKFDVGMSYPSSALWRSKELGVDINLLYPSDFETPFYGDTLFTHRRLVDKNPNLVRRFREATIRGWQYAMDRPEEVALRIAADLKPTLPVDDFLEFCRFEADMIREWIRYPEVELGTTNSWRWASLYRQLARTGLVKGDAGLEGLVLDDTGVAGARQAPSPALLALLLIAAALTLGLLVLFLFTSLKHWGLPLVAAGIIFAGIYAVDQFQRQAVIQNSRFEISNRVGALRAQFEGALKANVQLVQSIASYAAMHPDFSEQEFSDFAERLQTGNDAIRAIVVAPDLVVKYAHPKEGNEAVIGLDYNTVPAQRAAALRAVETRAPLVAGPFELMQGGLGLVLRYPVFTPDPIDPAKERLWGLAGVSLDYDKLAAEVGLLSLSLDLDIALRGRDGLGEKGDVFYGDGQVFDQDPVIQDVNFASGKWQLAAAPRGGWSRLDRPVLETWIAGCLLLSLVLLILIFRERQERERDANARRLSELEATRARAQSLARVSTMRHDLVADTVTLSPELCELLGLDATERCIPDKEFLQYVSEKDRERINRLGKFASTSNTRFSTDAEFLRTDGKSIFVHMQSEVVMLRNGKPAMNFIMIQDITKRYEAEHALQESEERFTLAMLGSNDMLWDVNLLTRKVYYSPRFREMLHLGLEDSPEASIAFIHPDDRARVLGAFERALREQKEKLELELRMVTRDEKVRDVFTRALVVYDENGTPLRMVGTNVDVTPLKNAEREALRLQSQLQQSQKMEAIGHLAGGIAHDFNNILASILGYTELSVAGLNSGTASGKIKEYLAEVERAATRARDLVRQLLSFSRPDDSKAEYVSVSVTLEEVLKILKSTLLATIDIRANICKETLVTRASTVQLHQLILNLVINARDSIVDTGHVEVSVTRAMAPPSICASCRAEFSGEYACIRVSDNGCGIPPEIADRIFEPFYTSKQPGRGSGMGLAVVHGTLHSMGGHLIVDSVTGEGTTITVYLPLEHATASRQEITSRQYTLSDFRGRRILVAEDEDAVAGFLVEALQHAGFEVAHRPNGREALNAFKEGPDTFDLILTDHSMPEMSGVALAGEINRIRPDIPIILVSGYTDMGESAVANSPGITKVMQKPVRIAGLLATIGEVLTQAESSTTQQE